MKRGGSILGHGRRGRGTRSCVGIPRASLGIWKMMAPYSRGPPREGVG